ncbi:MAG TPA: TIM barrel protein [Firmicutes bacterium]|nr:TIM barrel protein [Bacillota bacterium]
MLKTQPGLVSITFRPLSPEQIIELVAQAGLAGIEWGGDVHVPHGNVERAEEVRRRTIAAGLRVASYGSYWRAGENNPVTFADVVRTAETLEAPVIRIWAGKRSSAAADEEYRQKVINDTRLACDEAAKSGIGVAFEYHQNTLADNTTAALRLFNDIGHENLKMYWQPQQHESFADRVAGLKAFLPILANVHVTTFSPRQRLEEALEWQTYLELLSSGPDRECWTMIEFVKDDTPAQFLEDAAVLLKWLRPR